MEGPLLWVWPIIIGTIIDSSYRCLDCLLGLLTFGKPFQYLGIPVIIQSVEILLAAAKLRQDAALISIFNNLKLVLDNPTQKDFGDYNSTRLVREIMDDSKDSPRIFVINLPEADTARTFCAEIINRVFRYRKNSFTLQPKIAFVFDEAQEFIPYDKKKEDGTEYSSRAVEKLLRHGRKYNLHGWISTQRIAHLNTNALQQLHSYFVSTMPRPYDRQLISDTFAIDDAFMDRTLTFQNGDWLMASFKATNTQNVPVFFHAINNEGYIVDKKGDLRMTIPDFETLMKPMLIYASGNQEYSYRDTIITELGGKPTYTKADLSRLAPPATIIMKKRSITTAESN